MDHPRQEVGRQPGIPPLAPQPPEIVDHLLKHTLPLAAQRRAHRGAEIACPVGPRREQAAIFPREIEQCRQHLRGEFGRNPVHPVECLAHRQAVEQRRRARADRGGMVGERARAERGRHSAPHRGMLGPIHRDEHRQLDVGIVVQNGDAAVRPRRREELRQRLDMRNIGVARDGPIRPVEAGGAEMHGIVAPQACEHLGPAALPVQVVRRNIEHT